MIVSGDEVPCSDRDVIVEVVQTYADQCWSDPALLHSNQTRVADSYLNAADDVDFVAFPELALTGYIPLKGYDQVRKRTLAYVAHQATEEVIPRLAALTRDKRAAMVVGFMEASATRFEFFNSVALLEGGGLKATYRKLHLPVEENHYFVPGDEVVVAASRRGPVALSICYDLLFPEVGRLAALRGAELLFVCSNWLGIANLRRMGETLPVARALENQYHVVFINGVGELEVRGRRWALYGRSLVVGADGEVVARAGEGEEKVRAVLPSVALDTAHDVFPVMRDRRPMLYRPLAAPLATRAGPELTNEIEPESDPAVS